MYFIFNYITLIILFLFLGTNYNSLPKFLKCKSYLFLFIIIFILTYYLTENYNLSLFVSLIVIIIRTIYRYNTNNVDNNKITNFLLFLGAILLPLCINYFKSILIKTDFIKILNLIILYYIFFSIFEYIIHYYIMHCNKEATITKFISKIPFIGNHFIDACDKHMMHHLSIKNDMGIKKDYIKQYKILDELFYMSWKIYILVFIFTIIFLKICSYISNYTIKFKYLIIIALIFPFLWCYIWNKTHIRMHNLENNYSLKKGPYDQNLINTDKLMKLLYTNHKNHHLQKGEEKGNYNVVLLGADEWFCKNNKKITLTPQNN